jgi:phosphatidylglycerophosphate synthase
VKRDAFFLKWSSLHGNTPVKGIVRAWLTISYALVKPLAAIKTSPHLLTVAGVFAAVGTWRCVHSWVGIALLVLSLLCDGIDGSLAMVRSMESTWGAITDSVADRISEFFWALAFYALGAPLVVVSIAWLAAGTQEYVRARMGGLGAKEITQVTIAERPVRASILFVGMVSIHTNFDMVNRTAWMWMIMQLISFVLVVNDGLRRLK